MANVNRARSNDAQEFNDEDINDLSEGKTDAQEIFEQSETFTRKVFDIRQRLEQTDGVLSAQEQQKYKDRLIDIEMNRDKKGLRELDKEMVAVIEDTQKLTHGYFEKLDANSDLFGLDKARQVDTLQEYKTAFRDQSVEGKKKYLESVDVEIGSLQQLQDKLIRLVGKSPTHIEEFRKLRRHEKRDEYLPELENVMKQYESFIKKLENSKEYGADEIRVMEMRFKESSLDDQKKLLKEWGFEGKTEAGAKAAAETANEFKAQFDQFSPTRQKKFSSEFESAKTKKGKTEVMERMREDLKKEYMGRVNTSKYLSPEEKYKAMQSVSMPTFDIKFIELCLKTFGECENSVKKLAKTFGNAPKEVQDQYKFWESGYEEKQRIIEEVKEHSKIGKEFEAKVKKFAEEGIIAKKSMSEDKDYIMKWRHNFRKLSLPEKRKLMQSSSLDLPIRKQVLDEFKKLPDNVKKANEKEFMKGNLGQRIKLLAKLKEEIKETGNSREKFIKKVEDLERRGVIASKSATAYKKWIETLSVKDLKKYMEKSELDDPRREKMLELFEALPKDVREKNANFANMDLNERIALMSKLKPGETKQALESSEAEEEAHENVIDFKKRIEIKTLRKVADQFKENGNVQAETQIHQQILELNPKDKKSLSRLQEIQMMENPLLKMLDAKLSGNAELQRQVEGLQIVDLFEQLIQKSELMESSKGLEDRSSHFKNTKMKDLNKALYEQTGGKQILDEDTGRAMDVEDLDVHTLEQGTDQSVITKYVEMFREERPTNTQNQRKNTLRKYTMHRQDGRELKGEEMKQRREQFEDKLAQKLGVGNKAQDRENLRKAVKKTKHSRLNTYDLAA